MPICRPEEWPSYSHLGEVVIVKKLAFFTVTVHLRVSTVPTHAGKVMKERDLK